MLMLSILVAQVSFTLQTNTAEPQLLSNLFNSSSFREHNPSPVQTNPALIHKGLS